MITYIKKSIDSIYVEFQEALDPESHQIGKDYNDYRAGLWVPLSADQLAFHNANHDASVKEVLEMKLNVIEPAPEPTAEEKREWALNNKLALINQQDKATEVFMLNGVSMWLDKGTRASLIGSTLPAEKAAGATDITLWYESMPPVSVTIPIDWLESKLAELELYAKSTYDVTQQHKANVCKLTTAEDITAYDHTSGYPEPRIFVI